MVLTHSLQRHHYLKIDTGGPQAQNSIMHRSVSLEDARRDGINLGKRLFREVKRFSNALQATVTGSYRLDERHFEVDRENHFFVTRGTGVWSGVRREEWMATRSIRLLELDRSIVLDQIQRMHPGVANPLPRPTVVNGALQAFRVIPEAVDDQISEVSGRSALVRAIRGLERDTR